MSTKPTEYYGFAGNILYVNLSTGEIRKEPIDLEIARKYVGGFGMTCKFAYDIIKPGIDPFSSENPILISVGVLVGTPAPSASKIVAMTKCPFLASEKNINAITFGSAGSSKFGIMMKNAGYDHLIILGKSKAPVYIKIQEDTVEICEAVHLWGKKDSSETVDEISKDFKGCGAIAIGAAGENLVSYSMTLVDKRSTLGRNGIGAIFGSKNLKAIAVRGGKGIKVSNPKEFMKVADEIGDEIKKVPMLNSIHQLGLHASWPEYRHALGSGNWGEDEWDKRYGIEKCKEVKVTTEACTTCSWACKGSYKMEGGSHTLSCPTSHYTMYANMAEILELEDQNEAIRFVDACTRMGICAFRVTGIINWVTKLSREGRITIEAVDGEKFTRNFDGYMKLLEKIAKKEGFGDVLADGWIAVSQKIGIDATEDYTEGMGIIKGVDALLDPRVFGFSTMTFGYIVNPRTHHGMIHSAQYGGILHLMEVDVLKKDLKEMGANEGEIERIFTPTSYCGIPNVARATKYAEDCGTSYQALGICEILRIPGYFPMEKVAKLYSSATGIKKTAFELKEDGERISNLFKMLNVREGFSREEDQPPPVWFKPIHAPRGDRVLKDYYMMKSLTVDDLQLLIDDYYEERGWGIQSGIPTMETLRRLALEECIQDIQEE